MKTQRHIADLHFAFAGLDGHRARADMVTPLIRACWMRTGGHQICGEILRINQDDTLWTGQPDPAIGVLRSNTPPRWSRSSSPNQSVMSHALHVIGQTVGKKHSGCAAFFSRCRCWS